MIDVSREQAPIRASSPLLKAASRRLRSAKSDEEALEIAAECVVSYFNDALLVVCAKHTEDRSWEWRVGVNRSVPKTERVASRS